MKTTPPNQDHQATVKPYTRHIFFSTANPDWPSHIEEMEGAYGDFVRSLDAASTATGEQLRITAFHDPKQDSTCRILTFPDELGYRVLPSELAQWSEAVHSGDRVSSRFSPHLLAGHFFFVCVHGNRDIRCGECGPPLIEAFEESLAAAPGTSGSQVFGCSHYGGHKFAGNVLVYPEGDWYGYISPDLVPELIDSVVQQGKILAPFWRGRRGLTIEEQKEFAQRCTLETPLNP